MDASECLEEQQLEVEALESIYDELYCKTGERSFTLLVLPTSEEEESHAAVRLGVRYGEMYPQEPCEVALERVRGAITQGQVDAELRPLVDAVVGEAAGDVCVFMVAEAVKEWLADRNEPELSMHEQMMARSHAGDEQGRAEAAEAAAAAAAAAEAADEPEEKYEPLAEAGAVVTPESFAAWKLAFERQQAEAAAQRRSAKDIAEEAERNRRPTGRELFERNKDLGVVADGDEAAAGPADDVFFFSEAVYRDGGDDDEDLPDTGSEGEEEEEEVGDGAEHKRDEK